jgi:hypothetical protein
MIAFGHHAALFRAGAELVCMITSNSDDHLRAPARFLFHRRPCRRQAAFSITLQFGLERHRQ